ncbi:MAG: hypothetical protein R3277_06835 [Brumimicrobium sp.]|nr:hypothetical protein [Brumimicrobium sp.]
MAKVYIILSFLSLFTVITSCKKTDWDKEVSLPLKINADTEEMISKGNFEIEIENIEINITQIRISGERLQGDDVDKVFSTPLTVSLSNLGNTNYAINLPIGTYEDLGITVFFESSLGSSCETQVSSNAGQPFQSTMLIPLNLSVTENSISNKYGENVVLIDENAQNLQFNFDFKHSFESVDLGIWEALMNANIGQAQIDLTSVLGEDFKEEFNEAFVAGITFKIIN